MARYSINSKLNPYFYRFTANNFCKLCPIKYVGQESKTFTLSVPYETSCEQNNICDSDISITTSIYGVG